MNGLEAIELMKQGKMVKRVEHDLRFRLNGDRVEGVIPGEVWRDGWIFDINNKYEEYIEPKPLTGWERVAKGEKYVSTTQYHKVKYTDLEDEMDDNIYGIANYFSTAEKADEINFKQTLFRKLQRFSDENGGNEIDWNNFDQPKYYIKYFCYDSQKIRVECICTVRDFGQVYFVSEEVTQKAIELFLDDLIKYFTHDWSEGNE